MFFGQKSEIRNTKFEFRFQPLLYQVASAALAPSDIARPIREILYKQKNAVVIMGEVIGIDKEFLCASLLHTCHGLRTPPVLHILAI
jgi:hypothetical protein